MFVSLPASSTIYTMPSMRPNFPCLFNIVSITNLLPTNSINLVLTANPFARIASSLFFGSGHLIPNRRTRCLTKTPNPRSILASIVLPSITLINLALYLEPWSEQGQEYVRLLQSIMLSLYKKEFFNQITQRSMI